jgi:hypothetical protein
VAKPTKAEGAKKLKSAAQVLKGLCDDCCKDCPPGQCAQEAQAIVDAIVAAWNDHFGKGSNTSKDEIGGYLCWDWARFFRDAVKKTKPKCWKFDWQMAVGPHDKKSDFIPWHYWLALWACQKKDKCKVMIDDGWFDDDFVHTPPWPGKDWPLGNKTLPPETPKK